ncbi:MAG: tetraacyldisaccharide 4'-kinase [Pseudomonadota bacterium]
MFEKRLKQFEKRIEQGLDTKKPALVFSFEWFLLGFSHLYGLGVRIRLYLYKIKIFKSERLPCFVISVGNMVVGGAGKTPMAIYLAQTLIKLGKKPVVVSRGYKGEYKDSCLIVSDGKTLFCTAKTCGDEPFMMAKRKLFPVVVGKNRVEAGRLAIKNFDCDVIVLDDGFGHLKLERNLDLLLMDWENPLGNNRFLPAGRLRETADMAIPRADAIILTRCPQKQEISEPAIDDVDAAGSCLRFVTSHSPFILKKIKDNIEEKILSEEITKLKGQKAFLFSGIARNKSFYKTIKEAGINILGHLEFKDHYRYKDSDIKQINLMAKQKGADLILTTEKDWAKLDSSRDWQTDMYIIGINISFHDPDGFQMFLKQRLQ